MCFRYNRNLHFAHKSGIRKGAAGGAGTGFIFCVKFLVFALAFWYGAKLVREEEAYTVGVMLVVSLPM